MKQINLLFLVLVNLNLSAQEIKFDFDYFGQSPPDTVVKEFIIPSFIKRNYNYIGAISFSPSGNAIVCDITDSIWSTSKIAYSDKNNGIWSVFDTLPYCKRGINTNPIFYNDEEIYFSSWLNDDIVPTTDFDIFKTVKKKGKWNIPEKVLELSQDTCREFMGTFSKNGEIYFVRLEKLKKPDRTNTLNNEIYSATLKKGKFTEIKNLGKPVNTIGGEVCPFIDPSGKYLLFGSSRDGGYGLVDTYISFRKQNGTWTYPQNVKEINTPEFDANAIVTPDGKYLIFIRREDFKCTIPNRIYWVSAKILEKYSK